MKAQREKPAKRSVYAVCDTDRNACKIGVSNDVKIRLRNLQTASPKDFQLAHEESVDYPLATKVESLARRNLVSQGHSKKREWINNCSPEEAKEAIILAHVVERGRNNR